MSLGYNPPPVTSPLDVWAQNVVTYLQRTASRLAFRRGDARTTEDGVILWDETEGYPVVSKGGEYRQIVLADGFAFLTRATDVIATASSTGFPIVFDAPAVGFSSGITLGASPNESRIIFTEGGVYSLDFTAQVLSASASQIDFWFWPRINGVDVPTGATRASLHENTSTKPVTKGAVFSVQAGDYLEAYWATTNHTSGTLEAFPATAFSPATPSVSLSLTRLRA